MNKENKPTAVTQLESGTVERILAALAGLQYGTVEVVVHDGRVV